MAPGGQRVRLGVVDDDQMLVSGLRVWLAGAPDLLLVATATTVTAFLALNCDTDVVLLDLRLQDGSEPAENVARLRHAGHRVLVVTTHRDQAAAIGTFQAGAEGYLTKDNDLPALARAMRTVAAGGTAYSPELAFSLADDRRPARPVLSAQEEAVLVAYASGLTLAAAARRAGVRPGTAKEYLDRVKAKYRAAGRPAPTKLDLADRVREDGLRPAR